MLKSILVLLFTIIVEVLVAFCLGYRKKTELAAVALVNLITNPLLNLFEYFAIYYKLLSLSIYIVLSLEILVVLTEWALLKFSLTRKSKRLFILSLTMNTASYLGGVIFFRYI
jgi:hypothetical protein